jgi:hypothetical protein
MDKIDITLGLLNAVMNKEKNVALALINSTNFLEVDSEDVEMIFMYAAEFNCLDIIEKLKDSGRLSALSENAVNLSFLEAVEREDQDTAISILNLGGSKIDKETKEFALNFSEEKKSLKIKDFIRFPE